MWVFKLEHGDQSWYVDKDPSRSTGGKGEGRTNGTDNENRGDHTGALSNGGSQHRTGTTILEAQWQIHGPRPVQSQGFVLGLMLWGYRNGILNL